MGEKKEEVSGREGGGGEWEVEVSGRKGRGEWEKRRR